MSSSLIVHVCTTIASHEESTSSLNSKNKFLIWDVVSAVFFLQKIQLGYTARQFESEKSPHSFVFNSENDIVPNKKIFDGLHIQLHTPRQKCIDQY